MKREKRDKKGERKGGEVKEKRWDRE